MGTRILYDRDEDIATLYDSVTETSFGSLFHSEDCADDCLGANDVAEQFLKWYAIAGPCSDPRADDKIGDSQHRFITEILPTLALNDYDGTSEDVG